MNQLQIGKPIQIAELTIIPVEQIITNSDVSESSGWWFGSKELYALLVRTPKQTLAFDKNAQKLHLSNLISNVPKLGEYLLDY
ncbi:hypothetical protein [Kaarinaea lacus]